MITRITDTEPSAKNGICLSGLTITIISGISAVKITGNWVNKFVLFASVLSSLRIAAVSLTNVIYDAPADVTTITLSAVYTDYEEDAVDDLLISYTIFLILKPANNLNVYDAGVLSTKSVTNEILTENVNS